MDNLTRYAEKSIVFLENILADRRLDVSPAISETGRFDRTIFRYCRYLRKSRNDFFTRPQPTDSRRSYYDPRPFGTQSDRIQGVWENHRLYRKIFFIVHSIIAENCVTKYPVLFPILSKMREYRYYYSSIFLLKNENALFEDIIVSFIFER